MKTFDVIVVGFGPTGATLAALLGQRGLRVAVFDRLPDLYPLPRAIGLDHEVMRVMQELGIEEQVLPHAAPYRPSEYRGVDGTLIQRLDMAPEPHPMGWAPNYVFNQPAFERALRGRVAQWPNVEVHLSSEVQGFDEGPQGVSVRVRHEDGTTARYAGRYLVACDGGGSPVRKQLGIRFKDLNFDEPWLVVDALVDDAVLERLPSTQVQYCEPERPSTYVVGPGRHRRWELMLMPGDQLPDPVPDEALWRLLARWIRPGEATLWRAACYRFHGLVAEQWRRGRVLLAGDAAHMTPPFMAQGMVAGIRDAHNLAWKLERVLGGASPDTLLDTYGLERSPHAEAVVSLAIELGKVICERDPAAARARDAAMLESQGGMVKTRVRQSMLPGLKAGLVAIDTPGAGELFPQPLALQAAGAPVLLDRLSGATTRVFAMPGLAVQDLTALARRVTALPGRLVCLGPGAARPDGGVLYIDEAAPLASAWLESRGARFAIVRPDHHVFGTASTLEDLTRLLERFETALGIGQP